MKDDGPTREGSWSGFSNSNVLGETMVAGRESTRERRPEYAPGTAVSRYVILYEVGAGGMGVVYAAFDPQLNRKIALKILVPKAKQRRRNAAQAATRLMREAQAIARLSHPNVVNVYDVGQHDEAVFVAMEFIEGITLTRWLESEERSLLDIRKVFALAGRGLAAAHEAGLVHRDFKPDNVLVSPDGRVRVLDFGLARADPTHASHMSMLSQISQISSVSDISELPDEDEEFEPSDGVPKPREFGDSDVLSSPLTRDDTVVGTPRYMAPEQHAGVGVDARSDQFSFCVALYQALYGQEPFPANRLHDLVRLKQRGMVAEIPADSHIPPWLEDLVMRGLRPRPVERSESMHVVVEALEQDPQDRRRRWLSLAGGAVVLVTVTAVAGHRLGSGERLCQDSEAHLEGLWDDARRETVRDAVLGTGLPYAEHTVREVERRLDAHTEQWVATHRETCEATRVRGEQSDEMLDLRMSCLQDNLGEVRVVLDVLTESDPAVVQRAVGMVSGIPGLERCADVERLRAQLPPPQDEATRLKVEELRHMMRQAQTSQRLRRMDEARNRAEQVLSEAEALGYEPLRVEALATLGIVLEKAGEYPEAEARMREAMWSAVRIGHERIAAASATQLATVVGDRLARYDEGLTWAEHSSAILDHMGEDGMPRVHLWTGLGNVWHRKGDNDKALDYYQRAIARREELSEEGNPSLSIERVNLGNAHMALGHYEEAVASYQEAEVALRETLGEGHPQIALAVASLGVVYNEMGRYADALVQHRRALPEFESWLGPDHLYVGTVISNTGAALQGLDKLEPALEEFRKAQQIFEKSLGPEHPQVAACLQGMGTIRRDQGRFDEAQRLLERSLDLRRKRFEDTHEQVIVSRLSLAELQRVRGDARGAVVALETLASTAASESSDPVLRADIHFRLALARWDSGQVDARVRGDLSRAREFLDEAGARGHSTRDELSKWQLEHPNDDRPRGPDGEVLSVEQDDAAKESDGEPERAPKERGASDPSIEPLPKPTPPPPTP